MNTAIQNAFEAIGANLFEQRHGWLFEIDVRRHRRIETFRLTYPEFDDADTRVYDVDAEQRHLVLDVLDRDSRSRSRYLYGHDEHHWFVAGVRLRTATQTVRGAIKSLKPDSVLRAESRLRAKRKLSSRPGAAFVRQGEWFFLPCPMMHVGEKAEANGMLVRLGSKPHRAEWIYRPQGSDETFVRGAVSHPDHATIRLQLWHRVVQNNEVRTGRDAASFVHMAYLD